jgi:geranylgeranyl reductase family protein
MSEIYDAIVVGGGPGGATAAYFLGEAGRRVLVLEKERLPRYKTCGGGLSSGVFDLFPFSFEPVIESRVRGTVYALRHRHVTIPMPGSSIHMVMREDFDAHILSHACAEVRSKSAVRSVTELEDRVVVETRSGETYESRYLVGADGASSTVARSLGLRRSKTLVAAIEVETPVPPPVMERFAGLPVFIFGEVREGYLWVFPKAEHLSVGIAALHPRPGELQATLERVMRRYQIPLDGIPRHGHPIPIYTGREPIATRRALLVGDAAGLVDPFSGEGIRYAVKSGKLAAEAILDGRLEDYPRRVQRQIGSSLRWAAALTKIFYTFPRACFHLGVRNPFVTYAFQDLITDHATYPEVIVRMFATLPLFVLTEVTARLAGKLAGPVARDRVRGMVYPVVPEYVKGNRGK